MKLIAQTQTKILKMQICIYRTCRNIINAVLKFNFLGPEIISSGLAFPRKRYEQRQNIPLAVRMFSLIYDCQVKLVLTPEFL